MRCFRAFVIILAIGLAFPSLLSAQAIRNAKEHIQNEKQIALDKRHLARDRVEVREFETLLKAMDALDLPEEMKQFKIINGKLQIAMKREHDQAKRKVVQASREVWQSRREARGELQEARTTGETRDRLQARDDRRDLRDDRRDRTSAKDRAKQMGVIIKKTKALKPALAKGDPDAISDNRVLLGEFLQLLRDDLMATEIELGEDRGERREDRRERRTDRQK